MFGQIGGQQGIGGPLSPDSIGGEDFIRHIGNDKLIFDFKEGSGTTVRDKSHCGNDGTFGAGAAAPTWKRNSLSFDGGDYVDLRGINHGISTGGFTFCCNIYNVANNKNIFDQQNVRLNIRNLADKINLLIGGSFRVLTGTGVQSLRPISIQITRDKSGNLECHVNGESGNAGISNTANLAYINGNVKLGSAYEGSDGIISTMYSFRILNKGLSGIECQQEYLANRFRGNN